MAKKKETGTSLVKWDEEFANLAKEATKGIKAGADGKFISFSGGRMSFGGADIPDDEIRCVIVGWTHHNIYYDPDVRYDPKNPQSPLCYAFGTDEEEMEPHSEAPEKQCDSCAECPLNQFETSKTGRGKACKNTFRVALIAEDDLDDIGNAEVVYASIPPKSLKNLSTYLTKDLDKLKRPFWSVVTLMTRVPDSESQFRITFKFEEMIEDANLFAPLKELWKDTMEGIDFPYQIREAPAPVKGKAKPAAKAQKFSRK